MNIITRIVKAGGSKQRCAKPFLPAAKTFCQ